MDDLDVLAQPDLELADLSLAGVPFGSIAAEAIERQRVTEVDGSPLSRSSFSSSQEREARYYGADGQQLPLDDVIDSVIGSHGTIHCADKVSYKISDALVVGFAIRGANRGHLAHFGFLRSYEEFLALFGKPDRVEESVTFGDLLGYRNYYWRSRRSAYWDTDVGLSSVNLGDYEGNARG